MLRPGTARAFIIAAGLAALVVLAAGGIAIVVKAHTALAEARGPAWLKFCAELLIILAVLAAWLGADLLGFALLLASSPGTEQPHAPAGYVVIRPDTLYDPYYEYHRVHGPFFMDRQATRTTDVPPSADTAELPDEPALITSPAANTEAPTPASSPTISDADVTAQSPAGSNSAVTFGAFDAGTTLGGKGGYTAVRRDHPGETWKPLGYIGEGGLYYFAFVSETVGFADFSPAGADGVGTLVTRDGGHTWTPVTAMLPDSFPETARFLTDARRSGHTLTLTYTYPRWTGAAGPYFGLVSSDDAATWRYVGEIPTPSPTE